MLASTILFHSRNHFSADSHTATPSFYSTNHTFAYFSAESAGNDVKLGRERERESYPPLIIFLNVLVEAGKSRQCKVAAYLKKLGTY